MIPFRQKNLRLVIGRAIAGPRNLFAIGTKHGQAIKTRRMGDSHWSMFALAIYQIQFEIFEAVNIRCVNQILSGGMKVWSPRHDSHFCQRLFVGTVKVHGHNFSCQSIFRKPTKADAFAVRRKEGTTIIARTVC